MTTPHNTGKVEIGRCYIPPPRMQMTPEEVWVQQGFPRQRKPVSRLTKVIAWLAAVGIFIAAIG